MTVHLPSFAIPFALLLAFVATASMASPENDAEIRALRAQLAQMKSDTQALEARLHELEAANNAGPRSSASREATAQMQAAPMPRASISTYSPTGPALRQPADPAPYEAASDARIAMFRVAFSIYRWVPVGSRQLAVFNTYDQAYLLDFADDCPGLLHASRIEIQNFSTRVRVGEHSVIADGQHCLIANIRELRIPRLPKELRP